MFHKISILAIGWLWSLSAAAVTLQALPQPADPPLNINPNDAPIPCAQIVQHLQTYNTMALQHSQSLTSFLDQVSGLIGGWYGTLSPLEGTPQSIAAGTFAPLQDGANKISQLSGMAGSNADLLSTELANIITSLQACPLK